MAAPMILESAIPEHLRVERTIPPKTPPGYQPPFPAYSARFPKEVKGLVTATIGVQHKTKTDTHSPEYKRLIGFVDKQQQGKSKPRYWEAASVTDNRGYYNEVVIPYWETKADFEAWKTDSGFDSWWQGLDPNAEVGWFLEVFLPSMDRFETVFSDNIEPEGAAFMRESVSGTLQEHVYWGSMRDRLAVAQTDHIPGEKAIIKPKSAANGHTEGQQGKRIRVSGRKNLAMIRSGQDWSNTNPHERKLYLDTMHPVLIKGMDFLRDEGEEVGCISCRFMDVIPKSDEGVDKLANTDKTFGLAYFDDLASLEDWSKRHKTHLDIFGRFIQYAGELQGNVSLRLFHEVMVLEPDQQYFEYVGCHDMTGMLASVA